MLFHGIAKIASPESMGYIHSLLAQAGLPGFISYGVYVGEVAAPFLIMMGVYSRLNALIIVGNMLFVVGLAHLADVFTLNEFGGYGLEVQALFLFSALSIVFLGGGRYALFED